MSILIAIAALVGGLVLLTIGADRLIIGGTGVARRLRLSEVVIGATIVAAGTSMPEVVASVTSAIAGAPGLAIGNVVGSNSFNIGFILGVVALIAPMAVAREILRRDWWLMAIVTALLTAFFMLAATSAIDGRGDGAFLGKGIAVAMLLLFAGLVWWSIKTGHSHEPVPEHHEPLWRSSLWIAVGIVLLTVGGKFLVDGAVDLAKILGINDTIIGLTIVAGGTSAPELITSLLAARRKQHEIAVANIVGSNTFNILFILGLCGIIAPLPIDPTLIWIDAPVMLAFALALPIAWGFSRGRIGRAGGVFLLSGYLVYLGWLIAKAFTQAT